MTKRNVWQHVGFTEGNEDELYEALKKVQAAPAK